MLADRLRQRCRETGDQLAVVGLGGGGGRTLGARLLHVFDFADGLISRESAWLDVTCLQRQLGGNRREGSDD